MAEFRSGRPVVIAGRHAALLALPVEGIDARRRSEFVRLCAPAAPFLAVTKERARVLGFAAEKLLALKLRPTDGAGRILSLAADAKIEPAAVLQPIGAETLRCATAAIDLAKLAQALPAVLAAPTSIPSASDLKMSIVTVQAKAIGRFRRDIASSLRMAAETALPLSGGISGRLVEFIDRLGRSQVALIVGQPNFSKPVPVRVHSACLTGDVFGSRRCDCGDQLRLSLARLQEAGGGVVLYLAQEGRGLGLTNKIRAYGLQDAGLDTVDANTTLGFEHDERDYLIAARMLEMLGCRRVLLLSNNPAKFASLRAAGIDVDGRIPLVTSVTPHNRRYLAAKATRAGHRFGHLMEDLEEDEASDISSPR